MVHLLPVAVNFTLLGLYVGQVLWTPTWPSTNVSNALQFAAKIHETLMIASLVSVLLHHIRYKLLSPDGRGLPLGLVTSPFRLLDVSYLWSQEFSAAFRGLRGFHLSEITTVLIHFFLFVLAAVLGPASAITMLPRLGEWQIAKTVIEAPFYSTQNRNNSYHVYMGGGLSDIFPRRITASYIPDACDYSDFSRPETNTCARIGLTDIVKGILPPDAYYSGLESPGPERPGTIFPYNITVQAQSGSMLPARTITVRPNPLYLSPLEYNNTFEATADVTTSTDAVLHLAHMLPGYYLHAWGRPGADPFSSSGALLTEGLPASFTLYPGLPNSRESSSVWKQPHVSSFCSRQEHNMSSFGSVTFPFILSGHITPYKATLDSSRLSVVLNNRDMGFINSSNLDITPSYTPSAAFVFTSQSHMTLCLVKARWIDFSLSGSFSRMDGIESQRNMENLNWTWQAPDDSYTLTLKDGGWFNEADATENIDLDLGWLDALDHGTNIDEAGKYTFFDGVRKVCLGSSALDVDNHIGKHPDITCMACGLGTGIAEGLSKAPFKSGIYAALSTKDASHDQHTPTMTWNPWISTPRAYMYTDFGLPGYWINSTLEASQIMANSTRLDFIVTQKLYGYSFSGITITLAFVVLFLYVVTVVIHISIMTFGTSWSSRAWKSLGEFYIMALQSPIPITALENTGGGVKVSKTWQARAAVQELEHGRRVGVVVTETGHPDSTEVSMSKVRPDWKYS